MKFSKELLKDLSSKVSNTRSEYLESLVIPMLEELTIAQAKTGSRLLDCKITYLLAKIQNKTKNSWRAVFTSEYYQQQPTDKLIIAAIIEKWAKEHNINCSVSSNEFSLSWYE